MERDLARRAAAHAGDRSSPTISRTSKRSTSSIPTAARHQRGRSIRESARRHARGRTNRRRCRAAPSRRELERSCARTERHRLLPRQLELERVLRLDGPAALDRAPRLPRRLADEGHVLGCRRDQAVVPRGDDRSVDASDDGARVFLESGTRRQVGRDDDGRARRANEELVASAERSTRWRALPSLSETTHSADRRQRHPDSHSIDQLRRDVIEGALALLDSARCRDRIIEAPMNALRIAREIWTALC